MGTASRGTGRKLGRLPHDPAKVARCVQAHDILNLSTLPSRPVARDWSQKDGVYFAYPMFRNNALGICVIASLLHKFITSAGQTGTPFAATDADATEGYEKFGGFVEGDPSTDNGCVMLDVVKRLAKGETLAGQTIKAFVAVNPKNLDLMAAVCEFFGGIWMGWDLPLAWQGADEWGVSPTGSTSGKWAPASWGRHATLDPKWSPLLTGVETWTEDVAVTLPAVPVYGSEAYAIILDHQWTVLTGDKCPAGVDVQKLIDLLPVVGG